MDQPSLNIDLNIDSYPPYITPDWVAEHYGVCRRTIDRWIETGFLPPFSSPGKSTSPGWDRVYFCSWQAARAQRSEAECAVA